MNRIFIIINLILSYVFFSRIQWKKLGENNGWECRTAIYEYAVILDEQKLIPYKTLNLCKVWKRKFISYNGKSLDLPSLIDSYTGPVLNMETGQVSFLG